MALRLVRRSSRSRRAVPNLHPSRRSAEGPVVLRGKFPIRMPGGRSIASLSRLKYRAISRGRGRVYGRQRSHPAHSARHVNAADGTLCVVLPDEAFIRYAPTMTVLEYLNGPLRNFFIGQLCVENGDPWPWGEHAHGFKGTVAYYSELLGVDDALTIGKILYLRWGRRYKGHWRCPCGSGQRSASATGLRCD